MKKEDKRLFDALKNDYLQRARAAIDAGANVNVRNEWRQTPLHHAAADEQIHIARVLIENGADVNSRNKCRETPLHWAAIHGCVDAAGLLIANGADLHARDQFNRTPLDYAVTAQHDDMVALLQDAARKQASHAGRVEQRRADDDQERTR